MPSSGKRGRPKGTGWIRTLSRAIPEPGYGRRREYELARFTYEYPEARARPEGSSTSSAKEDASKRRPTRGSSLSRWLRWPEVQAVIRTRAGLACVFLLLLVVAISYLGLGILRLPDVRPYRPTVFEDTRVAGRGAVVFSPGGSWCLEREGTRGSVAVFVGQNGSTLSWTLPAGAGSAAISTRDGRLLLESADGGTVYSLNPEAWPNTWRWTCPAEARVTCTAGTPDGALASVSQRGQNQEFLFVLNRELRQVVRLQLEKDTFMLPVADSSENPRKYVVGVVALRPEAVYGFALIDGDGNPTFSRIDLPIPPTYLGLDDAGERLLVLTGSAINVYDVDRRELKRSRNLRGFAYGAFRLGNDRTLVLEGPSPFSDKRRRNEVECHILCLDREGNASWRRSFPAGARIVGISGNGVFFVISGRGLEAFREDGRRLFQIPARLIKGDVISAGSGYLVAETDAGILVSRILAGLGGI